MKKLIVFSFLQIIAHDDSVRLAVNTQIMQLQSLQQRLEHIKPNHALFDQLQSYSRQVGQLATTVVSFVHTKQMSSTTVKQSKLSMQDQNNIIQIIVAAFSCMVEFARYCHEKRLQKKVVQAMTYQDFVLLYPQLVLLEQSIKLFDTLIALSKHGTMLEQIFARIVLTGMALPKPYEKYTDKQAKKMYTLCFDIDHKFVYANIKHCKHPYKKFKKKVIQDWKILLYRHLSNQSSFDAHYESIYKKNIDNEYNKALLMMIDAVWQKDADCVQALEELYPDDELVKKIMISA